MWQMLQMEPAFEQRSRGKREMRIDLRTSKVKHIRANGCEYMTMNLLRRKMKFYLGDLIFSNILSWPSPTFLLWFYHPHSLASNGKTFVNVTLSLKAHCRLLSDIAVLSSQAKLQNTHGLRSKDRSCFSLQSLYTAHST